MHETTMAPLIGWSRAFPATPAQVREARQFLTGILDGHPATGDAVPGGHFRVRAETRGSHVRVEVSDQGGPWERSAQDDEQNGRGLLVVAQLARAFGRTGDEQAGWTVWFECG